jgi:hypothetical protein
MNRNLIVFIIIVYFISCLINSSPPTSAPTHPSIISWTYPIGRAEEEEPKEKETKKKQRIFIYRSSEEEEEKKDKVCSLIDKIIDLLVELKQHL